MFSSRFFHHSLWEFLINLLAADCWNATSTVQAGTERSVFLCNDFLGWIINGFYHSAVTFIGSILIYRFGFALNKHGEVADHWSWGVAIYTTSILIVLGKAALVTNQWTKFTLFAIPGSFAFWIVFFPIYASIFPHANISREYLGVVTHLWIWYFLANATCPTNLRINERLCVEIL